MNTSATLAILGALCVLGASGSSDDVKNQIKKDLQTLIDSIDSNTTSGLTAIRETAEKKYKTAQDSWTAASEKILANVLPEQNPFFYIRDDADLMLKDLEAASEADVAKFMARALVGGNSFMKRILAVGTFTDKDFTTQIKQLKNDGV